MTSLATLRVSLFRLAFALSFAALVPATAAAAPISLNVAADGTFEGAFEFDNDVALFEFVLEDGTFDFLATTTSNAAGGFDGVLSLFTVSDAGLITLYTYPGAEPGAVFSASVDDPDSGGLDPALSLSLTKGSYILALTQTGNLVHEDYTFDWDDVAYQCGDGSVVSPICEQTPDSVLRSFGGSVVITNTSPAPVPEPGTLSLLALGSLSTAALRRRRARSVTTHQ